MAEQPSFADLRDCMSSAELLYGDYVMLREICGLLHDQFRTLPYWLEGGSLIGALRHHSFVPYDDDIDLSVPHEAFNRERPRLHRELEALGYTMKAGKGGKATEIINGVRMCTYWQVFLTPHKAQQILRELYGRPATRREVQRYLQGPQPYLDFLLVWNTPDGRIQFVGDYYGNPPFEARDIFPLKTRRILGVDVKMPRDPVRYLKTEYKTTVSPVTHAVIWSEHKKDVKPLCNQRLRASLLEGTLLRDMNAYLKQIFGRKLRRTTKRVLARYA